MQWLKGLSLFGVSFGVVFCAVCFANALTLDEASAQAKGFASVAFVKTEEWRLSGAAYIDEKLAEAEAAREAKIAAAPEDDTDGDQLLVAEPKSLTEQIKDSSGLIESIKIQVYKGLSFVLNTVYAFYGLLALIAFWLVRKIFKRARGY